MFVVGPPRVFSDRRRARAALVGASFVGALLACVPGAARAEGGSFEVAPWLGWAGGVEWQNGRQRDVFSLNAGLDTTAMAGTFGGAYGGAFEVRVGPWLAFESPTDRGASGEGGLTLVVTQTEHASFGTFGLRFGAGHGGDRVTHVVTTLWGGVRFVPARAGQAPRGPIAKVTGVRIVATSRSAVTPIESTALVFGVEFEPEYFLPPYSLYKWGGKH